MSTLNALHPLRGGARGALAALVLSAGALSAAADSHAVSGRIVDLGGMALPDATVIIKDRGTGAELARARTDAQGRYGITGVAPAYVRVEVSLDGFQTSSEEVALDEKTVLHVGLKLGHLTDAVARVSGIVRGPDGAPLADTAVSFIATYRPSLSQFATTDRQGRFTFQSRDGGAFIVAAGKPCFEAAASALTVVFFTPPPPVSLTLTASPKKGPASADCR